MLNGRRQPSLGRTSRVNREVYARFCERLAVRFRGPTRQLAVRNFSGDDGRRHHSKPDWRHCPTRQSGCRLEFAIDKHIPQLDVVGVRSVLFSAGG